jgi:hypothetical protein
MDTPARGVLMELITQMDPYLPGYVQGNFNVPAHHTAIMIAILIGERE